MLFMETDTVENGITNLRCSLEGDRIKLTFRWPEAIEQVYIFKTGDDFDIEAASPKDARLFTLQEYKKQAGFIDRITPGVHTYRIIPFIRGDNGDIAVMQYDGLNCVTGLTGQVIVQFSITEKRPWLGTDKVNDIKLLSDQYIEEDVLCYVKKENAYPIDSRDGVIYFFGEALEPGRALNRQVKTRKNEYIRIFIHDPEKASLYKLIQESK